MTEPERASPAQQAAEPAEPDPGAAESSGAQDAAVEDAAVEGASAEASAPAKKEGRLGSGLGLLGFIAALALGFFLGPMVRDRVLGSPDTGPWTGYEDLARYTVALSGDEPQKGPDDALVTIIEFSDYECPFCMRAHEPLMDALDDNDDVRLIFKHMPLPMHAKAIPAARAAWAAQQQGKFWEMHDHLFSVGGDLADIEQVAEDLGLDVERFRTDMGSAAAGEALEADRYAAGLLGIGSTPHFVINGRHRRGAMTSDHWDAAIEHARAEALAMVDAGTPRASVYDAMMENAKGRRARAPNAPDPGRRYAVHRGQGRPSLGPEDALVTVVEFSDFQCPYCAQLAPTIHALPERHADVRVLFRQKPLSGHELARPAAIAALAAHRQGAFWAMHDALFERGGRFDMDDLERIAEQIGLDMDRFAADREDPALAQIVDEDLELARKVGVNGTPASFVNGRYLGGTQSPEAFDEAIAREREAAQALVDAGTPPGAVLDQLLQRSEGS